jgi:hypothetical protein
MTLARIATMEKNKVEGTMDIWYEQAASERTDYRLVFVPYSKDFQTLRRVVTGDHELETFLLATGFETAAARGWLKDVRSLTSVSIDNVFVPRELVDSQPRDAKDAGQNHGNPLSAFLHSLRLF